jgi:hypothetical protein
MARKAVLTYEWPERLTFQFLWRAIPTMTADQYLSLEAELEARGWVDGQNFRGMLVHGLEPSVRRQVFAAR